MLERNKFILIYIIVIVFMVGSFISGVLMFDSLRVQMKSLEEFEPLLNVNVVKLSEKDTDSKYSLELVPSRYLRNSENNHIYLVKEFIEDNIVKINNKSYISYNIFNLQEKPYLYIGRIY